ncbi:MAG: MarR family transcriptional regulator [Erysipelotrichaceae bacterium]|nr:MarR family transcriptional regulator [Erysipelotrichaceae bacterium]
MGDPKMMNDQKNVKITVSQKMQKIGRMGIAYAKERVNDQELSTVQYKVCITIYNNPGLSQDAVARDLGMDKSSIAKLISKLMDEEIVRRDVNPRDRREYQLYLTEKGTAMTEEFLHYMFEWETSLCRNVGIDHALMHQQLEVLIKEAEALTE